MQMLLACMRMICDTPAILGPDCRVCPKLEELEGILGDLLQEPDRKIIIFSEWELMLALVRELAAEIGVEAAWHTASVPQARRREEINRFKSDPNCRLFLSTGSVGLNLQAASAVINIDMPWNPAKLEQRIARAGRKYQTRTVTVINLVTEGSIEHAILHLLNVKQVLADGLLDGQGDIDALKMPSGRGALVDRMRSMLDAAGRLGPKIVSPEDVVAADLRLRHGERALMIEIQTDPGGAARMLAVLDLDASGLACESERLSRRQGAPSLPVEVVDRATWVTLRRLARSGIVNLTSGSRRILHISPEFAEPDAAYSSNQQAHVWREEAERAIAMASVLTAGGFPEEAPPLLEKALRCAVAVRQLAAGEQTVDPSTTNAEQAHDLLKQSELSVEAERVLAALRSGAVTPNPADAAELARSTTRLVAALVADHVLEPSVARAALTA